MTISQAMEELVEKVRELGVGDYFDGLDYDNIIELGLYYYGKHIEENIDEIKEEMYPDENDSGSDEDSFDRDWCDFCMISVEPDGDGDCPHCFQPLPTSG
jgi:hypothetical protein